MIKKLFQKLWFKFYLNGNEFSHKLSLDLEKYKTLNKRKRKAYLIKLSQQRSLAHNLS